jgi:UDP-N-acetylmuramoyl-tripeptide--D-alanyl-D-alanine ligase
MPEQKYLLNEITSLISNQKTPFLPIQEITIDSRAAKQGDLFFALGGAQVDGHQFIPEVAAKGCQAAVVNRAYQGPDYGLILIKVDDPLASLQEAAREMLAKRRPKIIAVTGSVGKTTTKEFIFEILKPFYRIGATPGNSNSQIGLPLSILNHTNGEEEILILEMGMTHPGQIKKLVEIAPPDIALITLIALVHAANFDNISDIARAKAEIFTHPRTKFGILDRHIENYDEICCVGSCKKLSFAIECSKADYSLAQQEGKWLVRNPEGYFQMNHLTVPGYHNNHNYLAAVTIARCLGLDWEKINSATHFLKLPEKRFELVEKNGVLFVNDSYNASEISTKAALNSMPNPKIGGKKIAVVGEMLELGKFSAECHYAVGLFSLKHVDFMLCFGKECQPIQEAWKESGRPVEIFMEREELLKALKNLLQPGDVVLLKASKKKELWKILDEI